MTRIERMVSERLHHLININFMPDYVTETQIKQVKQILELNDRKLKEIIDIKDALVEQATKKMFILNKEGSIVDKTIHYEQMMKMMKQVLNIIGSEMNKHESKR
jgi:hypothetical protein